MQFAQRKLGSSDPLEIFKIAEQLWKKAPTPFSDMEKMFYIWFCLPVTFSQKLFLSPQGTPWVDYHAFKHFAINLAAIDKTYAPHSVSKPPASPKPRVSEWRTVAGSNSSGRAPFSARPAKRSQTFKRTFTSGSGSKPSFSLPLPPPIKKGKPSDPGHCIRCNSSNHHIGDSVNNDGKTPVCPLFYDNSKNFLKKPRTP